MVKESDEFSQELALFLKSFEPYQQKYFSQKIKSGLKYAPLIADFYKNLADFSQGGKRMRAFFVWLGYRIGRPSHEASDGKGDEDLKKILPICLAIEIVHSFLLIHDDVIDQSDTRRFKSTIHKRYEKVGGEHYGMSQAIILGDIACFEAFELVSSADFDDALKIKCIGQVANVLLETGYGEALDVETTFKGGAFGEIYQVMDLKTARYSFVGPLALGATLGSVQKRQVDAITGFGLACGIAYQLADDILGVFGDEETTGKPSDLHEGKNTLLIYKALEDAKPGEKGILRKIWGDKNANQQDLKIVQEIISSSGALEWSRQEQGRLTAKAKGEIEKITVDKRLQLILLEVADFVISRRK
ncbi:MAG: polyprenyl synthetase family protein [Candidatus Curtissbacteria bacterium]|nr:polyprenyl synthetase family protein [Candidatus Curtissbacteria bacterium]